MCGIPGFISQAVLNYFDMHNNFSEKFGFSYSSGYEFDVNEFCRMNQIEKYSKILLSVQLVFLGKL